MAFLTEEISQNEFNTYGIPNATYDSDDKKVGGSSISFNGTDQYIAKSGLGPFIQGNNWTIAFWIKCASTTSSQVWFHNWIWNGPTSFSMYKSGSYFRFNFNGWPGIALPTGYVGANSWTHIAIVRNGNNWKCFADGVQRVNLNEAHTGWSGDTTFYIARGYDGGEFCYFNGKIDEFWITDTSVYTTDFTPPLDKIINPGSEVKFLMHFDEPQYRIMGNVAENSRMFVFNEDTWALENSEDVTAGAYELNVSDGTKVVVAIPESSDKNGEVYRGVTPIEI